MPLDWFFNHQFIQYVDDDFRYGVTKEMIVKIHSDFYKKELEPYAKLWIAVLDRAIKDASGSFSENIPTSSTRKRLKDEAIWFLKNEDWIYNILGIDKKYFLKELDLK